MYERINSFWKVEQGKFFYSATVTANTQATLYLPTVSEKTVKEGGKEISNERGIQFVKVENGKAVCELSSGNYTFTALLKK